jgi:hypothetical protein
VLSDIIAFLTEAVSTQPFIHVELVFCSDELGKVVERSASDVSRYHPISYIDVVYSLGNGVACRVNGVRFSVGPLWFPRLRSTETGSGWAQHFFR